MVAICVRRQPGSRRLPLWEEAATTACSVQNMHLQASALLALTSALTLTLTLALALTLTLTLALALTLTLTLTRCPLSRP